MNARTRRVGLLDALQIERPPPFADGERHFHHYSSQSARGLREGRVRRRVDDDAVVRFGCGPDYLRDSTHNLWHETNVSLAYIPPPLSLRPDRECVTEAIRVTVTAVIVIHCQVQRLSDGFTKWVIHLGDPRGQAPEGAVEDVAAQRSATPELWPVN